MQKKILCKECKKAHLEIVVENDYYHDCSLKCPLCGFTLGLEVDAMGNLFFKMILFFMSCIFAMVAIILYVIFDELTISVIIFGILSAINFIISLTKMI